MRILKNQLLSLLFLLGMGAGTLSTARAQNYTGMVSFGDSLSDLGNTIAYMKQLSFTDEFIRQQTGYNGHFYDNQRFSDGRLWSERLNDALGFDPMQSNNGTVGQTGTNFSWAGSTSGTGNTSFILPNLLKQIGYYTGQVGAGHLPDPATTLFTIWSGGNDVINLVGTDMYKDEVFKNEPVEGAAPITPADVAANISSAITSLYDAGGRTFLVPNLPPLGFKPDYRVDDGKRDAANNFVNSYNPLLENALVSLSDNLDGIVLIRLDIHTLFLDIIEHPEDFDFTNVEDGAYTPDETKEFFGSVVPNPDEYLFWDNSHGTTAVNQLIATQAYQAVVPEPSTGTLIMVGVFSLVLFRPRTLKSDHFGQPDRRRS